MDLYNVKAKTDNGELFIGVNVPKKYTNHLEYIDSYLKTHFDNYEFIISVDKADNSK